MTGLRQASRDANAEVYRLFREDPEAHASSYLANFYRRGKLGTHRPRPGGTADAAWRAGRDSVGADADGLDGSHDALNRMRRAHARGTGCYLTAEMIHSLSVTTIAEMWAAEDPRAALDHTRGG